MPLPVPRLDDRTFDDLVAEAKRMIPKLTLTWTDHNPTDPGIALVELFAWAMEMSIYRIDRVPESSVERFLRLVGAPREAEPIDQAVQRALRALAERTRAVTLQDFEALAMRSAPGQVARVKAGISAAGTATVVIVPTDSAPLDPPQLLPDSALLATVHNFLDPPLSASQTSPTRCLITTRLDVIGPIYQPLKVSFRVVRDREAGRHAQELKREITNALWTFFHPLRGGWDGRGWEFGRGVYRSELYQLLERWPHVDHVEDLTLQDTPHLEEVSVPALGLVSAATADLVGGVVDLTT